METKNTLKSKTAQIFVIMGALAILVGALWYWLYFRPHVETMENWRNRIAAREERLDREFREAEARRVAYAEMDRQLEVLSVRWAEVLETLPEVFEDTVVLRHIEEVIYPHTDALSLSLGSSTLRSGDLLYSTTVSLSFTTSYWQFLTILHNLVQGELGNRVVVYSLAVSPLDVREFITMRDEVATGDGAEFIPEHIRPHFMPGGDIEPAGLHMFVVSMNVEYLSIEPLSINKKVES